ncbi:MAG TPA: hypothetical protein VG055_27225, partial [Planctomycetaceae bacterium]|nr:hypothetical protein [Planctomycetaceae bacterium]
MPSSRQRASLVAAMVSIESLEPRWLLSASVVSYHNDAASDGQNLQETVLTPSNVNSSSFGKLFTASVDGQVYAQPLVVPDLSIAGRTHNVVFAATEHDSVYALDAGNGQVLWHVSFLAQGLPGATSITTVPSADAFLNQSQDIAPEVGITSTPVIDPTTNTLYVVAATKETVNGVAHYVQRLHALDLATGSEKFGGPVLIGDTTFVNNVYTNNTPIWVNGTGDGNDGNGHVFFNAARANQRAALTLVNGQLYIAWASYGDNAPYHGWIAAFNPTTLALTGVLNTTPSGSDGGIWMGGGKLSSDPAGNLYVMTGNGTFDGDNSTGSVTGLNAAGLPVNGDYGDSFLKISLDTLHDSPTNQNITGWGLQVSDYFTPFNQAFLDSHDRDLGSGGILVLPDSAGDAAHPQLLVGAGKQGAIYLLDRDNLGKFSANQTAELSQIVEETATSALPGGSYDTPAYFNQSLFYVPGRSTAVVARDSSIPNGSAQINPTPTSSSPDTYVFPGSTPSVSANGTANGIIWDLDRSTNELRAYNATGYNGELYTSGQATNNRDALGTAVKFSVPTVANGHVYVGTTNSILGYGLFNPPGEKLVFQSVPPAGTVGQALSPALAVAAEDQFGDINPSDNSSVSLAIASGPAGATLGGTLTVQAVNGVATFNNLALNLPGTYTLVATDGNLASAVSTTFYVTPITELTVPTTSAGPRGITAGPDGNVWFSEYDGNEIGRISPNGSITEFGGLAANALPESITTGPDGNLWFIEPGANQIGRITPTGAISEFPVPTANSDLNGITTGPDGNVWFTELESNQIGYINPTSGAISEFTIPTPNAGPAAITLGPDGNLWFAESSADQIG